MYNFTNHIYDAERAGCSTGFTASFGSMHGRHPRCRRPRWIQGLMRQKWGTNQQISARVHGGVCADRVSGKAGFALASVLIYRHSYRCKS